MYMGFHSLPVRDDMGYILWVQSLIHILYQSLQFCIQSDVIFHHFITTLHCICLHQNYFSGYPQFFMLCWSNDIIQNAEHDLIALQELTFKCQSHTYGVFILSWSPELGHHCACRCPSIWWFQTISRLSADYNITHVFHELLLFFLIIIFFINVTFVDQGPISWIIVPS